MLSLKGKLLIVVLFLAAVLLTGRARLRLDEITAPFRDDFREMLYLPRGEGLKILACGFDAPLADALFIKGMIYYAESIQAEKTEEVKESDRGFTYALFDVITDLSPRFTRAYQMGSLFLTASASMQANRDGCRLLEKGVATYDKLAKGGKPVDPDARWLFHTLLANTYEVNIQARLRQSGDAAGAAEARQRAAKEFRLAAASPGAPGYVQLAAAGYQSVLSGQGGVENSQLAVLSVWKELYNEAQARGDKDVLPDLEARIEELEKHIAAIQDTRKVEEVLTDAGKRYLAREKAPAVGVADLLRDKLIPGQPPTPLGTDEKPDTWVALPDGSFKSRLLAAMETQNHLEILLNAVIDYRRAHGAAPPSPEALVEGGFIPSIPVPPLAGLGEKYEFDPKSGRFTDRMPEGPELPPERR